MYEITHYYEIFNVKTVCMTLIHINFGSYIILHSETSIEMMTSITDFMSL